jgi:hypothetical protein
MIDAIPHLVWAGATASIAYAGHRVAVTWLNQRERANVAAADRAERESGVNARCDVLAAEVAHIKTRVDTFIANNGGRR